MIDIQSGPPSTPVIKKVIFEGREVEAETFKVREINGVQEYVMIRAPFARNPYTRVTVYKGKLTKTGE